MKPLKVESRSTKLLIPAEHMYKESSSQYDEMLDDVNMTKHNEDDDDDDDCHDEETRFISTERSKTSYYTSTERT